MKLYLMRHAEAVPELEWGKGDADRPLSKKGQKDLENALDAMALASLSFHLIVTSPYIRARQTADIMSRFADMKELEIFPNLKPGASTNVLRDIIESLKEQAPLLIVGHVPDLEMFSGRLVGDVRLSEDRPVPGEIIALETGPSGVVWDQGKMLWRRTLEDWGKVGK